MPTRIRDVSPGARDGEVRSAEGATLFVPDDWALLPPGDAALSRRVKAEGPCWTVKDRRGKRVISLGIWAPRERIERLGAALLNERQDPSYQRKLEAGRKRRQVEQDVYAGDFEAAVLRYLNFAATYLPLARKLAKAIAAHAVPVGSGTVARTQRIPIERRAEAATIAWLRHQTTSYDDMKIARVKGQRREVRWLLAQRSKLLLETYRRGMAVDTTACPLSQALAR